MSSCSSKRSYHRLAFVASAALGVLALFACSSFSSGSSQPTDAGGPPDVVDMPDGEATLVDAAESIEACAPPTTAIDKEDGGCELKTPETTGVPCPKANACGMCDVPGESCCYETSHQSGPTCKPPTQCENSAWACDGLSSCQGKSCCVFLPNGLTASQLCPRTESTYPSPKCETRACRGPDAGDYQVCRNKTECPSAHRCVPVSITIDVLTTVTQRIMGVCVPE